MRVCVVMERPRDRPYAPGELFGVYTSEAVARADYGVEDGKYVPQFILLTVVDRPRAVSDQGSETP